MIDTAFRRAARRRFVRQWLEKKPLVVVGYFDDVRGVDFFQLLQCWLNAKNQHQSFEELYPYASDHFQIRVLEVEDGRTLLEILPEFRDCPHIQAWVLGEEVATEETLKLLEN